MSIFTVFGLQRSGTNFLEQMITDNISDLRLENHWRGSHGVWKHAFNLETNDPNQKISGLKGDPIKAKMIGEDIKAVYIHKHPYSWIESVVRKPIDIKKTHPSVIEESTMPDIMVKELNLVKMAELHREHSRYWLQKVKENKVYHIKFEDMISTKEQTRQTIVNIANFFKKSLSNNKITIIDSARLSKPFTEEDRESYKKYQIKTLTFEQVQEINKVLDHDILKKQGYSLCEKKETYLSHKI